MCTYASYMHTRTVPTGSEGAERIRVGATIKQMREMRGLTQEQLSNAALLSRAYVANIEAGRKRASQKAIARIADALHVPQISIIAPEQVAA